MGAFDQLNPYAMPSNTFNLSGLMGGVSGLLNQSGLGTPDTSGAINSSVQNPYGTGNLGNVSSLNSQGSYGGAPSLGSVYSMLGNTSPTVTTSQFSAQNPSVPLQNSINQYQSQLQGLANNTQSAYQGYQGTFQNLMNTLTNLYGKQGSTANAAAQTSALGAGANPLAASQAGLASQQNMLSQYFPALAQLQNQAGQVPVQAQAAQQSIDQMAQQFIQGVLSPYYQAIAGQNVSGQQTNPLAKAQAMAGVGQQGMQGALQQQQLQSQMAQAQMAQQGNYAGMGLQANQQNIQQQQYAQTQAYMARIAALGQQYGLLGGFVQNYPNQAYGINQNSGDYSMLRGLAGLGGGGMSDVVSPGNSYSNYDDGTTLPSGGIQVPSMYTDQNYLYGSGQDTESGGDE